MLQSLIYTQDVEGSGDMERPFTPLLQLAPPANTSTPVATDVFKGAVAVACFDYKVGTTSHLQNTRAGLNRPRPGSGACGARASASTRAGLPSPACWSAGDLSADGMCAACHVCRPRQHAR